MPYSIIWLIILHILPKLGIVAMNAVIILRLKRAFARPSLQENRSQALIANETSSSTTAYSMGVPNNETKKMAKITRSATKTSLYTIHEEISTVSQVILLGRGHLGKGSNTVIGGFFCHRGTPLPSLAEFCRTPSLHCGYHRNLYKQGNE